MNRVLSFAAWLAAAFLYNTFDVRAEAVSLPPCQATAPAERNLTTVETSYVSVPNSPFQIVYASLQKDIAFVSLSEPSAGSTLGVLNTSTFAPVLIHQIALPAQYVDYFGALGLALTQDGKYLFVAAGEGAVVVDTSLAVEGSSSAVVGTLNGTQHGQNAGNSAIVVTLSPDDKYAFISQEDGPDPGTTPGDLYVFELQYDSLNGSVSGVPNGFLSLGFEVVGTALSHNGRFLYATNEQYNASTEQGFLAVVNVEKLESDPPTALVSKAAAGCSPVRVLTSADGKVVWVTARESNHLLAFDANKLVSDPDAALLASVQVGTAPVSLVFVHNGTRIITADSNRFGRGNSSGLSVVDVEAALAGKPALLGSIPTGLFPRDLALSPDQKVVLVADYDSEQIQALNVSTIP